MIVYLSFFDLSKLLTLLKFPWDSEPCKNGSISPFNNFRQHDEIKWHFSK